MYPGMTRSVTLHLSSSWCTQACPILLHCIHHHHDVPRHDPFGYTAFIIIMMYQGMTHSVTLHSSSWCTQAWPIPLHCIHHHHDVPRHDPLCYTAFIILMMYQGVTHSITLHSTSSWCTQTWPIPLHCIYHHHDAPRHDPFRYTAFIIIIVPKHDPFCYTAFIIIMMYPGMTHSVTLHSSSWWWIQCNRMGHAWVTEDEFTHSGDMYFFRYILVYRQR